MYKRLLIAALLGSSVLVAGAMPAFTADSGSVVGTVNVPPAPVPCLTVSVSAIGFGTQPFSDPALAITPIVNASPAIHLTACSTAAQRVSMAASDAATASGGTWDVPDIGERNTCGFGPNVYPTASRARDHDRAPRGRLYNAFTELNGFQPMPAGFETDVTAGLQMPCRGSAGAGECVTMTFSFLAVLA